MNQTLKKVFLAPLVLLAAVGMLSGCGSNSATPPNEKSLRAVSTLTEFPMEISMANEILIQECIRKETGLNPPLNISEVNRRPLTHPMSNVFTSEAEAKQLGYITTFKDEPDALELWIKSLSAQDQQRYWTAFTGPPDGPEVEVAGSYGQIVSTAKAGCNSSAIAQVYGSIESNLSLTLMINEYLVAAYSSAGNRDAELTRLVPKFEQCMKDHGYSVTGFGVQNLAATMLGKYKKLGEKPNAEEQKLAAADFACQNEIDLLGVINKNFAQGADAWLQANEGKLLAMQEELNKAKDRAIKIING